MPRKQTKCIEDNCDKLTHGIRCRRHSADHKRKFASIRDMQRHHSLVKKYNLTLEEFYIYWQAFRGQCGICGKDMKHPEHRKGQSLDVVAVDHDHTTGKVRGLLCNACNKGLGFFKDSKELLDKAIKWLQ
jgi:hypothetical protein